MVVATNHIRVAQLDIFCSLAQSLWHRLRAIARCIPHSVLLAVLHWELLRPLELAGQESDWCDGLQAFMVLFHIKFEKPSNMSTYSIIRQAEVLNQVCTVHIHIVVRGTALDVTK